MRPLKIALLTHSTNPRGGVVHCLELADALVQLGHAVTLLAPSSKGRELFRTPLCEVRLLPLCAHGTSLREVVAARIASFVTALGTRDAPAFDVHHAHDGIGANALLELQRTGHLSSYVRTVHHVEASYGDSEIDEWEARSIAHAARLVCVSPSWAVQLHRRYGREAIHIDNGLDRDRFSPQRTQHDARLAARLGVGPGPLFLMVGGIEARKNPVRALQAFLRAREDLPQAQLLLVGGASLLDHQACRREFDKVLRDAGLAAGPGQAVIHAGVLPDADMPSVYRLATALLFPSLLEGFGLAIIEAMACGTPVVVSDTPPFTDFLARGDCLWVDPYAVDSMHQALRSAADTATQRALRARGREVAARFDWARAARAHAALYQDLRRHQQSLAG